MSIIFAPWREIDPEQQRTKQIKKKEGTNTSLLTCTENYFAFLSNWYTKMCGNLGEIPGTFSCSNPLRTLLLLKGTTSICKKVRIRPNQNHADVTLNSLRKSVQF